MATEKHDATDLRELRLSATAIQAVEVLAHHVGGDDLRELDAVSDIREKRERLVMIVKDWIDEAKGSSNAAFVMNVGAVAIALLALRHELEGDDAPSIVAAASVPWLLEPARRAVLLPGVAGLVEDLRDGIASEDGRAAFVRRARALLEKASRLDPLALDVAGRRLLLGGRLIPFRRKNVCRGRRVAEQRYLSLGNAEGRWLLLAVAGRAPSIGVGSIASHVRSALTEITHNAVTLRRDLTISPSLRLTSRAARVASRLRWVKRDRARQESDDQVRSAHTAPNEALGSARGVRGRV